MSALTTSLRLRRPGVDTTRRNLRAAAVAAAGAIALVYTAIALHLVTVIEGPAAQVARDQFDFAAPAAALFILGAILLARFDDRRLWVAGVVLQVLMFAMYLAVAPDRQPTFEVWGVTIRLLQLGLLVPLVLLAVRRPSSLADRDR